MKKIAILGSENSHCWLFTSVLSPIEAEKRYPDIELVGIYGEKGKVGVNISMEEIPKMSKCTNFTHDKDAFLDRVDADMIRDYIAPVYILEANVKAFETGYKIDISIPEIKKRTYQSPFLFRVTIVLLCSYNAV